MRVPAIDEGEVKLALDAGAEGICSPLARSAADVERCVALLRGIDVFMLAEAVAGFPGTEYGARPRPLAVWLCAAPNGIGEGGCAVQAKLGLA